MMAMPHEDSAEDIWLDDDAGPVVRPYAMTRGRTRPASGQFDLISLIVATRNVPPAVAMGLGPEHVAILSLCRGPLSVTERGVDVDDTSGVETKTTTTVAMDFGRITIADDLVLYLFGTPGQDRFWFVWDELALGALGAVVLADTRRLAACFPSVDYFEQRGTPFIVAVNCFDDARRYRTGEVQNALDLDPGVPVLLCDARRRESGKEVLIALVEHVMAASRRRRDMTGSPSF